MVLREDEKQETKQRGWPYDVGLAAQSVVST